MKYGIWVLCFVMLLNVVAIFISARQIVTVIFDPVNQERQVVGSYITTESIVITPPLPSLPIDQTYIIEQTAYVSIRMFFGQNNPNTSARVDIRLNGELFFWYEGYDTSHSPVFSTGLMPLSAGDVIDIRVMFLENSNVLYYYFDYFEIKKGGLF